MKAKLILKNIAVLAMVAAMSTVTLTACGSSSNDTATEETAAEDAEAEDADADAEDADAEDAEATDEASADGSATTGDETLDSYIKDTLNGYFMGQTETGEYMLYGTTDDSSTAMIAFYDSESNQYVLCMGPETAEGDNITVTDESSGLAIGFDVTEGDSEGMVNIDLGENGKGVLAACTADEYIEILNLLDQTGATDAAQ